MPKTEKDSTRCSGVNRWDLAQSSAMLEKLAAVVSGAGTRPLLCLCHNNPDPDSIAGAYAFAFLLQKKFGVRSVLGYGGVVTRSENRTMICRLGIKMTQLKTFDPSKYYGVALIDAQPGCGNNLVEGRAERALIVIDHHPVYRKAAKPVFADIRPDYGATSTIITEYLLAAGLTPTRSVANALLYGIKTDTNALMRSSHKADYMAFTYLSPLTNPKILGAIERPRLPLRYFREYHRGLSRTVLYRDAAVTYIGKIESEDIVPELADLLLRIHGMRWSLSMGRTDDLLGISMRATSKLYSAGNIVKKLIGKKGAAGGHREMAGGQIIIEGMDPKQVDDLVQQLVKRFLKLIHREGAKPCPIADAKAMCEDLKA